MKKTAILTITLLMSIMINPSEGAFYNERIKEDVEAQLRWDLRVKAEKIDVEVRAAVVTLRGTVSSFRAYKAAEEDAWSVSGVRDVENKITVEFPAEVKMPSDREITEKIDKVLFWQYDISRKDLSIETKDGVVTLRGTVESYWRKRKAEEVSSNLAGVVKVRNLLAVVPEDDYVDEEIANNIMESMKRNPFVDAEAVDVRVKNGHVQLSGKVKNWTAREEAYSTAHRTNGVIEVTKRIRIE